MPSFEMVGAAGEVRVGGRVAAHLTRWSLSHSQTEEAWTLTAQATEVDDYWLSTAGRTELRLSVGTREWRFRDARIESLDPLTVAGECRPDVL